jgi:very-short-patch-repair endonuclease
MRVSYPCGAKAASPCPDLAIAELAERRHGVVSRRQLLAAGVTDRMIRRRVERRQLYRVHSGAYSVTKHPTAFGLFIAAVFACGESAVLSHGSAAALWDLRPRRGARVDVLVSNSGRPEQRGIRIRTTRSLHPAEVASHHGIPCTSVARTIVDLGATLKTPELRRVLERALILRLFDRRALDAALERATGRRGTGILRRVLEGLDDTPPTRSELERRFLQLLRDASLPSPITNGQVNGYEVDFHWPDARLIVETDGRATHDNPFAFERDRQRDFDLSLAGWTVIRITWRQLRDEPERVIALLHAKLRRL